MTDTKEPAYTALVTGGGGFIGRAIVARLLRRGCAVRSFSRGDYPDLESAGVEVIRGELTDRAAVQHACAGCEIVFHVAAKAGVGGRFADYYAPNVRGTEDVVAACRAQGVRRLVFTSSPSVVFDGRDMEGADESAPYPARFESNYSATKAAAERMVLEANGHDLHTLSLRPHLVWGPGDNHIVPRIVNQAQAGRLRLVGRGHNRVDVTYIDNAADAHLLAADALRSNPQARGRAFFISQGEPVAVRWIINGILEAAGLPPAEKTLSPRVAIAAGAVFEAIHAIFRPPGEPRMTRFLARELATSHWFDITAARRELGYEPRVSTGEGLERLRAWFRAGCGPVSVPPLQDGAERRGG